MGEMAREIPVTQQSVDTWLGHKLDSKLPTTSCQARVKFDHHILSILQQWVQTLKQNFTWLLNDQTYTFSSSLVQIYRNMTKLCCLNQNNPQLSVFKHHAELTECKRVHWEDPVAYKLFRFQPTELSLWQAHRSGTHCQSIWETRPSAKTVSGNS